MIKIKVISEQTSLFEFLNLIGSVNGEDDSVFEFQDKNFAYENLVNFLYTELKNEIIKELTNSDTEESFIKDCYTKFSISEKQKIKNEILVILENTLTDRNMTLEFEAIKTFRLRLVKLNFKETFSRCLDDFIKDSKYNSEINSLKEFVIENQSTTDVLSIRTFENQKIGLFSTTNELISLEDTEEQENVVINAIMYAPKAVNIEDEYNVLYKETVIILKQIFENKITFV